MAQQTGTLPGTSTIDSLCTTLFATRSGDLGAATYTWGPAANQIVATFPAGTTGSATQCQVYIVFQPKQVWPSIMQQ